MRKDVDVIKKNSDESYCTSIMNCNFHVIAP